MYEDLINSNKSLTKHIDELVKELNKIKEKFKCVEEFAKGMSYNNPMQYEKLKEEIKRIDEDGQD
jgi:hypothetical protein